MHHNMLQQNSGKGKGSAFASNDKSFEMDLKKQRKPS